MENQNFTILMEEIREIRKEIKELRNDVWSLKTRFAIIACTFGLAGGKLSSMLPFLK